MLLIQRFKSYMKWRKLSKYLMSDTCVFDYNTSEKIFSVNYKDIVIQIYYRYSSTVAVISSNGSRDEITHYLHVRAQSVYDHLQEIYNKRNDPKDRIEQFIFGAL